MTNTIQNFEGSGSPGIIIGDEVFTPEQAKKENERMKDYYETPSAELAAYTIEQLEDESHCICGNANLFECSCEWSKTHPGNILFTCEFCGIYEASQPKCNKCKGA